MEEETIQDEVVSEESAEEIEATPSEGDEESETEAVEA